MENKKNEMHEKQLRLINLTLQYYPNVVIKVINDTIQDCKTLEEAKKHMAIFSDISEEIDLINSLDELKKKDYLLSDLKIKP